jgi:DNA polymerase elongation subunit (family B)
MLHRGSIPNAGANKETVMDIVIDIETIRNPKLSDELKDYRESKVRADSRTKDPEKVATQIADKRSALYEKDALDPNYGMICCIGYYAPIFNETISIVMTEEEMLVVLFNELKRHAYSNETIEVITFNGNKFDIPYITHRCAMLGIRMPNPLSSPPHCDVAYLVEHTTWLPQGALNHSLTELAILHGIPYYEDASGKDVQQLWDAGQYEEIRKHCESDVMVTWELYKRYKNYQIPKWRGQ